MILGLHHTEYDCSRATYEAVLWRSTALHDGDVVVDLGAVTLRDALCDPHDVAHLLEDNVSPNSKITRKTTPKLGECKIFLYLLLQLDECVEDAKVELTHVRVDVQFHLGKLMFSGCTANATPFHHSSFA